MTQATHLVLPGWWVRAFEAAQQAEAGGAEVGAMALASASGLAPALSTLELNALAVILGQLQAAILGGAGQVLTLSGDEHRKHGGAVAKGKAFLFERVAQLLLGLRLLGAEGGAAFPFVDERWAAAGDPGGANGQGEPRLALTLGPIGAEICLGAADAHVDLGRFARAEIEAGTALGGAAPLTLGRSIWLELNGAEQLLFLRLERAMQWEFRWLQLDGIFGLPLAELFVGLPDRAGPLAQRLRGLARLGKKLAGHGFLAPAVGDQYLALDDAGLGAGCLTLVWQAGRERLATHAGAALRLGAARRFKHHDHGDTPETLARLCRPGDAAAPAEARALWDRLMAVSEAPEWIAGIDLKPGQGVLPHALFLELALRQGAASRWPLPEIWRHGPLATATAPAPPEQMAERLRPFVAALVEEPEYARALRELTFATLASAATRADPDFAGAVAGALRRPDAALAPAASAPRLVATPRGDGAAAVDAPKTAPLPPAPEPRRQGAVSGALAARMLKTAAEELNKIHATQPERYAELKRAYLASLDETSRSLMLDVQRRIQPTMFESQLRQRLVRYMVDNPGAWRSAETGRAGS